jgi:TATA-box binding protein (TBP) (component of TFIID and TFIIIB)
MKYNNEKFPGLFVKFKEGTAILFHSGKVVLVGCKNEENLKCLTTNIYVAMKQLWRMKEEGV